MEFPKARCELCGAIFSDYHDECPNCGCPEIYEVENDEYDISPYDFFESSCSVNDTVGGV